MAKDVIIALDFPTREEIFDLPELQDGASFTVGGWIQETTTCRAAKQ